MSDEEKKKFYNLSTQTDEVAPHHYKESEDLRTFKSKKTGRGPLEPG